MCTARANEGHTRNVCDLEFQGQPSRSRDCFQHFWYHIHDIENVRIDTKINFVSRLQPEIWKIMQKGVWPWFSRSRNKDRIFLLSPLDSLTQKTYPWEIFSKNSDGKAKIQGMVSTPLGRFRLAKYLGHPRVNPSDLRTISLLNILFKYADDTYLIVPASLSHTIDMELKSIADWAAPNNLTLNSQHQKINGNDNSQTQSKKCQFTTSPIQVIHFVSTFGILRFNF